MPFLLDVNVIIAILDPEHIHHSKAQRWFEQEGHIHWLTCPTTENGVVRIVSGSRYPGVSTTPMQVLERLESLRVLGHHEFVPDALSLLDRSVFQHGSLLSSRQVTDSYLLGIAAHHSAALATLDTRMVTSAVINGDDHLYVIP